MLELTDAPPIILWSIPLFVIAMAVEWWSDYRDPTTNGYVPLDSLASVTMGLGYVAIGLVLKAAEFAVYTAVFVLSPLDLGWGIGVWVLVFVADDLAYYAYHRAHHEVRVLWASHVVHHSSRQYNLSTALRQPWTPFTALVFWVPLALIGVHPLLIVTAQAWNLLYQFWIHTERIDRMPRWFEAVMNTPSHHRVHHATNPQYLDRNYGGILIVWDRLFGTFEPEVERPVYGLTTNIDSFNPVVIAFHEWRDLARDLRLSRTAGDRLGFTLRGPGWAYERRQALTLAAAEETPQTGVGLA